MARECEDDSMAQRMRKSESSNVEHVISCPNPRAMLLATSASVKDDLRNGFAKKKMVFLFRVFSTRVDLMFLTARKYVLIIFQRSVSMKSTSHAAPVSTGKLHTTPVILGVDAMGLVTHGKGISCPPLVKKSGALIVDRVTCQHAGSHVLPRKTTFNTAAMSESQFEACIRNCGFCYAK